MLDAHLGWKTSRIFLTAFWIIMLAASTYMIIIVLGSFFMRRPSQTLTSFDWSGYSVISDFINPQPVVTSVNGSWTVPRVTVSQTDTFSAAWIGIGGQLDQTLIQIGTEQDSINGTEEYSAWYELLPDLSVLITTMNISPGDQITASIELADPATNKWTIEITDTTNKQRFKQSVQYDSSELSAEWIVERPTIDHSLGTLADFGSLTFTTTSATLQNNVGSIKDFAYSQFIMQDRQNRQLVTVSPLNSKGSSFTVTYSISAAATQFQLNEPLANSIAITPENDLILRLHQNSKASLASHVRKHS